MQHCHKCNNDMTFMLEDHTLIWTCPQCGFQLMTTHFSELETDTTVYSVILERTEKYTPAEIRLVAEIAQCNFLQAKTVLDTGNCVLLRSTAQNVLTTARKLKENGLRFHIQPEFPYQLEENK